MRTVHLNGLRALEAVLRTGSFRAAAEELNVTPAAVGQQVRTLESYLGRALFDRAPGGAVPEAETKAIAAQLTAAFGEIGAVLKTLSARGESNRLAVSMTLSMAEGWFPRELAGFFSYAGAVDLRLDSSRRMVDLAAGSFDFAIRHVGAPGPGLIGERLFPSLLTPVCTPDFARRYALDPSCTSLERVPLSHVPIETSDPGWLDWPGWCARYGIVHGPVATHRMVTHSTSSLTLAQSGLGLVLSALIESFDAHLDGRLVAPFGPGRVAETAYSYWLVWPEGRRLGRVQRAFRDWLVDRAAAHRGRIESWLEAGGAAH